MAIIVENNIIIYDLKKLVIIETLLGHSHQINKLRILSNGNIASKSFDNTIRLWDSSTFKCYDILKHSSYIRDFVVSFDDRIITTSNNNLILWTSSEDFVILSNNIPIHHLAILDNKIIGTTSIDIRIWNINTKICEKIFNEDKSLDEFSLLILGHIIVNGNKNGYISLYDSKKGKYLGTIEHMDKKRPIDVLCRISETLIASIAHDGTVRIWDLLLRKNINSFRLGYDRNANSLNSLLRLPNGNLVISSWDKKLLIYDPIQGEIIYSSYQNSDILHLLILPDGRFISLMSNYTFKIWE